MHSQEQQETGDDFHVELGDVEPVAGATDTPAPRSPLESRRTPRQRTAWLAATALAGLALIVLLSSVANVPGRVAALLAGPTPTATYPASLIVNQFYLPPNPPGVDVTLDGRLLTRPPQPGDPQPLRLSPGTHVFAWRSRLFPFRPLHCRISVPHAPGDTCQFVSKQTLPRNLADMPGAVIDMHASLAALDPATGGATALTAAIQAALDAHRSTAIVQPGEPYLTSQGHCCTAVVASQPLRATLSYQFVSKTGYPEPCVLVQPAIPCRFPSQDCSQLCTVAQPPVALADVPGTWIAAAFVSAQWTYTTLDGQLVASNVPEQFGMQLAVLSITWDGAAWHVTPIFGHTPSLDVADDAACDPLRFALSQTPSWSFMLYDPPPGAQVSFASDATPADGCVGVLAQGHGSGAAGIFLQRFGVLLTVNDVTRNSVDNLPVADAAERQLAQQLLAALPDCVGVAACSTPIAGQIGRVPEFIRTHASEHR